MQNVIKNSYVICTSPRSGSTMLCKLLSASGVAGNPDSHFHAPSIRAWLGYYGLQGHSFSSERETLKAIFAGASEIGKNGSDVFGLRIQRKSFLFFLEQLKLLHPDKITDRERIEAAFGATLFIYLRRDDNLDQAISRLRAEQTGLWHRNTDGTDLERLEPTRATGYDHSLIQAYASEAVEQNEQWSRWFKSQSIVPLVVTYEELSRRPQAILARIFMDLGIDSSLAETVPVQTAKLADETNLSWRSKFDVETRIQSEDSHQS